MEHKVEVFCNDEDQDFDIEIALPDYEFDDLIKVMMEDKISMLELLRVKFMMIQISTLITKGQP